MAGLKLIAGAGLVILMLGLSIMFLAIGSSAIAQGVTVGADAPGAAVGLAESGWALVGAAVSLVVALIVAAAKFIGVTVGAEARERLHSAVLSWARAAVARNLTIEQARAMLPDYLEESISDTMRRLKPVRSVIEVLFDGKYEVAKAETLQGFVEVEQPKRK